MTCITQEEYKKFCDQYLFEALRGHKFGPLFCKTFNIQDNLLLYPMKEYSEATKYIKKMGYVRLEH